MPASPLEILFQDEHLIAVMKPAKLASIPGRGETDSVLERLAAQIGLPHRGETDPRLRVVHRLDKGTSGVLLLAKDRPAQRHISHQFQNNTIAKEYLALVRGKPREMEGVIDAPLGPHPTSPLRMAVLSHGGRPARTAWRVEETFGELALIRCFPKTGKTHQIRVHLLHAGMPLAIDSLYNAPRSSARGGGGGGERPACNAIFLSQFKRGYRPTRGETERPLIERLTLHAEKLSLLNLDGQPLTIVAGLPKDLRATLNQLRRHSRR
jgi:RluA family pseudouridine synthase